MDKVIFKKRIIPNSLHTAFIFFEPLFGGIMALMMIQNVIFGGGVYSQSEMNEGYFYIAFAALIIVVQVLYLRKPAAIINNDILYINHFFWTNKVPMKNIIKYDADITFYIYFKSIDGTEDGKYVPIDRDDFERLSEVIKSYIDSK